MATKTRKAYIQGYKYAQKKLREDAALKRNLLSGATDWLLGRSGNQGGPPGLPEQPRRGRPETEAEKKKRLEKEEAQAKELRKNKIYAQTLNEEFKKLAAYAADGVADCTEMLGVFAKIKESVARASENRSKIPTLIPNLWEENAGILDVYIDKMFKQPYDNLMKSIDICIQRFNGLLEAYTIVEKTAVSERATFMAGWTSVENTATVASYGMMYRPNFTKMLEQGGRVMAELKIKLAEIENDANKELAF